MGSRDPRLAVELAEVDLRVAERLWAMDRNIENAGPEIPVRQGVGKTSSTQDLQHQDGGHGRHAQGQPEREDSRLHVM